VASLSSAGASSPEEDVVPRKPGDGDPATLGAIGSLSGQQIARLEAQQDAVIEFRGAVIGLESFAGFWVDSAATVHVSFVGTAPPLTAPQGVNVVVEAADFRFSDLQLVQRSVSELAEAAADPWVVASAVDEVKNRVVLFTTEPGRNVPPQYQATSSSGVPMVTVDGRVIGAEATAIIRGGQPMTSGCTAGFGVLAGAYRGMMTAGHPGCGDAAMNSQLGVPLCCVQQVSVSGGQDRSVYAISASGHGVSRNVKVDFLGGVRAITGSYPNSAFFVGFVAEKFGNSSGYRKGVVTSTTFDPGYVTGGGYFLTMSSEVPSWPGDSGGPNFSGNTAVGITSGCVYWSPATSCSSTAPSGNNSAIVGKIGAQLVNLGSWTLYLSPTDGQ
jgi:streptogrisin B